MVGNPVSNDSSRLMMKLPEPALEALRDQFLFNSHSDEWSILEEEVTPYNHLHGYMNRWWVEKPAALGASVGVDSACRIHQILRSDADRHLHDHPWPYTTIILAGGYWEVTDTTDPQGRWYGPGSVLQRPATAAHKLILPVGKTCWTMFMTGPYAQGWGFITKKGKVPWREYLGVEAANEYESTNPFSKTT